MAFDIYNASEDKGNLSGQANMELRELPQPVPSAGLEAYIHERQVCLELSMARQENYMRYEKSRRRSSVADYLPIKLDIENVSRCNYRCTMCTVSDWEKGKRANDMSFDDFKRIIDEQYGLVEIKLQGLGEPLMQGADFFKMIQYARAQHIWVRTTTNTSLLHLKNNYRKLIDADPNEVQISIDGATKDVFEEIRKGSHFETVKKNCRLINDYAFEKGKRVTKMWTVVQRANQGQLFELVDFAHEQGFRDQTFAFSLTDWGSAEWRKRNDIVTVENSMNPELGYRLIEKGDKLGIRVSFWNSTTKYRTTNPEKLCPWPFERAVVTSDLRSVPCCTIGNPDHFEIGQGLGKTFLELWSGREFEEFRQDHLDGKIPQVCKGCYYLPEGGAKK